MNLNVTKATLSDLDCLAILFDLYRIFYLKEPDVTKAKKFLSDRIVNKDSEIFVCVNNENILVGFVQLYPIFSSTSMKKLWLLNDLYVKECFRGNGYSVALIDQAKKLCVETGASGLILETSKKNLIANKLYPKTGFNLDDEHNYYSWNNLNPMPENI